MERGHDHLSPHRNGKGNSLSHYSTVVKTPFMAHIERHITLTLLYFVSRLVLIVEYITTFWIYDMWKTSCRMEPLSLQSCPVWRDATQNLWTWAPFTCAQMWSFGKVTWAQCWRWTELKNGIPQQLCLLSNCCVHVCFIKSAALESLQKKSVDISHLPVSRDVTLSENGWSSEVNP